jgi:C4-dicarboxylate-binding protein DctP
MKDATKYANDIAKKDNDEALAAVKKSGKTQFITLTAQERNVWKKTMDKAHKEHMGRIGPELVKEVYAATGYSPN